jgi:hypothetical protein
MTSFTALVTIQASGVQSETITETIRAKLKPSLRVAASLTEPGTSSQVKEILTGTALYASGTDASGTPLNSRAGRPWVKIDLSAPKGPAAARVAALVHSLQSIDPRDQTELLTLATNTRAVGVPKALAPQLQALGNTIISFRVWIDGRNDVRKFADVVTVNGETVRTTVTITSLNQPVHITLPPASQTVTRPSL